MRHYTCQQRTCVELIAKLFFMFAYVYLFYDIIVFIDIRNQDMRLYLGKNLHSKCTSLISMYCRNLQRFCLSIFRSQVFSSIDDNNKTMALYISATRKLTLRYLSFDKTKNIRISMYMSPAT